MGLLRAYENETMSMERFVDEVLVGAAFFNDRQVLEFVGYNREFEEQIKTAAYCDTLNYPENLTVKKRTQLMKLKTASNLDDYYFQRMAARALGASKVRRVIKA